MKFLNSDKDELCRAKFTSMQEYRRARDGWVNGKLELRVVITIGNSNGQPFTLNKSFTRHESEYRSCGIFDCDPRWVNIQSEIVTWTKTEYSNRMHYYIYEYDGAGAELTSTIAFPVVIGSTTFNITSSVKIKSEDTFIGESIVEYCDNSQNDGYTYNTGTFEFQVRQR
uniref:hypothetical protein n=2 Tax=Roseivirga sp. TaxID=1964215 RepID=UPI0040474B08